MNRGFIIVLIVLFIGIVWFGVATFFKDNTPTSYVTMEDNTENITKELIDSPITGASVINVPDVNVPIIVSLANKKVSDIGYLPKILILTDLVAGNSVKLDKTEIMIGQLRGDMTVVVALIGENTNNVYVTDGIPGNYKINEGTIDLIYENKELRIETI